MTAMNRTAAGAYVWALRERSGVSRRALGERIGTNGAQIQRTLRGEIDARMSLYMRFVVAVGGDITVVQRLFGDPTATTADGQAAHAVPDAAIRAALRTPVPALPHQRRRVLNDNDVARVCTELERISDQTQGLKQLLIRLHGPTPTFVSPATLSASV